MTVGFAIRNAVEQAELNLSDVRSKILECQSELGRLQNLEQQYRREVQTNRRIMESRSQNFVDRLFDELLFTIFLELAEDDEDHIWYSAAVCKRWRKICLDNPTLWTRFTLWGGWHECGESQRDAELALRTMLQLERSRTAPLYLVADEYCGCNSQLSTFRTLARHSSRWGRLDFWDTDDKLPIGESLTLQGAEFTQLQKLDWTALPADDYALKLPFGQSPLPQLRSVTLWQVHDLQPGSVKLPWGQLTSLDLCLFGAHAHDLLLTHSQCQSLESFRLSGQELPGVPLPPPEDIITLPNLLDIHIDFSGSSRPSIHIIRRLQLPSLRNLSLRHLHIVKTAIDLVKRSSCGRSLARLDLGTSTERRKDATMHLSTILQLCPNLQVFKYGDRNRKQLTISDAAFINDFIQSLVIKEGQEAALPRLYKLSLYRLAFDPQLMVQMVDSRIHGSGCLKRLKFTYRQAIKTDTASADVGKEDDYAFCKALLERRYNGSKIQLTLALGT